MQIVNAESILITGHDEDRYCTANVYAQDINRTWSASSHK